VITTVAGLTLCVLLWIGPRPLTRRRDRHPRVDAACGVGCPGAIVTTTLGTGLDQRPTGNARLLSWVREAAEEDRAPRPRWLDAPAADIDAALNADVEDRRRRSRSSSSGSSRSPDSLPSSMRDELEARSSSAWARSPGPSRSGPVRPIAHGARRYVR
jgi:hypothetical protein